MAGSELSRRPEPRYRCRIRDQTDFTAELAGILRTLLKRKSRPGAREPRLT